MALLARFAFLLSIYAVSDVRSNAHGTIEPEDCEGATGGVISCDGIDSPSTSMDAAKRDLGSKLNDSEIKLVRVYVKLVVNGTVYVPGKPVDGSNETADASLSLAFVYSKSEKFHSAYLSLPLPSRYYSAGLLSRDVRWRAKDNQTLLLSVNPGGFIDWNSSGHDERRLLIHTAVREALTASLRRYTDNNNATLTGELLVRGDPFTNVFQQLFLLYGTTYVYLKCSDGYSPQGRHPNGSIWEEITASTLLSSSDVNIFSLLLFIYILLALMTQLWHASIMIIIICKNIACGNGCVSACTPDVSIRSVNDLHLLDSRFPERLQYPFVFFVHKVNGGIAVVLFLGVEGAILATLHHINISLAEDLMQYEDVAKYLYTEPLESARKLFVATSLIAGGIFLFFLYFLCLHFQAEIKLLPKDNNVTLAWLPEARIWVMIVSCSVSSIPFLSNALFVIIFTTVTFAAFNNVALLTISAILKFVFLNVLGITRFYETVLSDILYEKKAVDSQLKRRVVSESNEHTRDVPKANVVDVREYVFLEFHKKRHPGGCVQHPGPYVLLCTLQFIVCRVLGSLLLALTVLGSMQVLLVHLNDLTGTSWSAVYSYILPAVLIIAPADNKAVTKPSVTSDEPAESALNEEDKNTINELISAALKKLPPDTNLRSPKRSTSGDSENTRLLS